MAQTLQEVPPQPLDTQAKRNLHLKASTKNFGDFLNPKIGAIVPFYISKSVSAQDLCTFPLSPTHLLGAVTPFAQLFLPKS